MLAARHTPPAARGGRHRAKSIHKGSDPPARTSTTADDPNLRGLAEALSETVARLEGESRHYSSRLLTSIEDERRRIGRELHDETSQTLAATLISLEMVEKGLRRLPSSTCASGSPLQGAHLPRLDQLKLLIYDLRPSTLDDLGLVPALRWYIESPPARRRPRGRGRLRSATARLPAPSRPPSTGRPGGARQRRQARRARRTSTSSWRSTRATRASRSSTTAAASTRDVAPGGENPHGLGLLSMQERVELLGGTHDHRHDCGGGTRIHVVVPVRPERGRSMNDAADSDQGSGAIRVVARRRPHDPARGRARRCSPSRTTSSWSARPSDGARGARRWSSAARSTWSSWTW